MTSAAGNNLATTSASQPSASSCSGGARGSDAGDPQPAINRSNLSPIVTEVLEFGRIPKQIKRPTTKEDHDENSLANRLSKKKKSLSDIDKAQLEQLKENDVSGVSASNLATTSASQPSASSCSAGVKGSYVGAAQPGMRRVNIR